MEHFNELSAECRDKATKAKERQQERIADIKESCASDIKKLCNEQFKNRSDLKTCLRNNKNKIADSSCKNKLEK